MYEKEYILFYTRRKRMNTKLSAIQYLIIAFIYGWSGLAQRPRYFKYKLPEAATRLTSGSHAAQRKGAAKTCCGFSSYRNFILLKTGVFFSNCLMKPTKRIFTPGFLRGEEAVLSHHVQHDGLYPHLPRLLYLQMTYPLTFGCSHCPSIPNYHSVVHP